MYSFYYDYVSSKEEYNRRKLCMNGYSKEAREIAAEHRLSWDLKQEERRG